MAHTKLLIPGREHEQMIEADRRCLPRCLCCRTTHSFRATQTHWPMQAARFCKRMIVDRMESNLRHLPASGRPQCHPRDDRR